MQNSDEERGKGFVCDGEKHGPPDPNPLPTLPSRHRWCRLAATRCGPQASKALVGSCPDEGSECADTGRTVAPSTAAPPGLVLRRCGPAPRGFAEAGVRGRTPIDQDGVPPLVGYSLKCHRAPPVTTQGSVSGRDSRKGKGSPASARDVTRRVETPALPPPSLHRWFRLEFPLAWVSRADPGRIGAGRTEIKCTPASGTSAGVGTSGLYSGRVVLVPDRGPSQVC